MAQGVKCITDLLDSCTKCKAGMSAKSAVFVDEPFCARFQAFLNDCMEMVSVLQNDVLLSMAGELTAIVEDAKTSLDKVPDPYADAKAFLNVLTGKKDSHTGKVKGLSAQFSAYQKEIRQANSQLTDLAIKWNFSVNDADATLPVLAVDNSVWSLAATAAKEVSDHLESVVFINALLGPMRNSHISKPGGSSLRHGLSQVYMTFCLRPELICPPEFLDESELLLKGFDATQEFVKRGRELRQKHEEQDVTKSRVAALPSGGEAPQSQSSRMNAVLQANASVCTAILRKAKNLDEPTIQKNENRLEEMLASMAGGSGGGAAGAEAIGTEATGAEAARAKAAGTAAGTEVAAAGADQTHSREGDEVKGRARGRGRGRRGRGRGIGQHSQAGALLEIADASLGFLDDPFPSPKPRRHVQIMSPWI